MILEHTGTPTYKPGVHWDLLCETGETLRAWEFAQPLCVLRQLVTALPDHRLIYLDYEGPISGERGSVRRVAVGTYELLTDSPTAWAIRLNGASLSGELSLRRAAQNQLPWDAVFRPSS